MVFNKLKELIQCQSIPGVSRYNEIFLHKQYASKTAPDILLNPDITIEIYADSSKRTWSNLLVVECKNHVGIYNRLLLNILYVINQKYGLNL